MVHGVEPHAAMLIHIFVSSVKRQEKTVLESQENRKASQSSMYDPLRVIMIITRIKRLQYYFFNNPVILIHLKHILIFIQTV